MFRVLRLPEAPTTNYTRYTVSLDFLKCSFNFPVFCLILLDILFNFRDFLRCSSKAILARESYVALKGHMAFKGHMTVTDHMTLEAQRPAKAISFKTVWLCKCHMAFKRHKAFKNHLVYWSQMACKGPKGHLFRQCVGRNWHALRLGPPSGHCLLI